MNDIRNYLAYHDQLSSSGMPAAEQMHALAQDGVQLIINLAPHDVPKALPAEAELVKSLGMNYINIPIIWSTPTQESLKVFMDTMDAHPQEKIHVHCEANFRASAFISLYRILRLGWQPEEAFAVMHTIWDENTYPAWKIFLDHILQDLHSKK